MEFISDNITKSTGVYRCPDNIKNFKIRVKIREGTPTQNANRRDDNYKNKEFSWQEKCFSKTQKEFYRDERNCFTDQEREFHRIICEESEDNNDDILFSYANEEHFLPENEIMENINYLQKTMTNLSFNYTLGEDEYDFHTSLQKSIDNPVIINKEENMYIMADFGEYFENTWLKNEKTLCAVKYNADSKVLRIFPDFTTTYPYIIKMNNDEEKVFSYFIENCSNDIPESTDANEKTLIKKVLDYQASIKNQHLKSDSFKLPPKYKLYVFLFLEISFGKHFEYPEVYVQYSIQLPEGWSSSEPEKLKGRTQFCKAFNEDGLVHFGHCVDVLLEYNFKNLENTEFPKSPYIYFEVISKDSWDRFRTEGVCYKDLPISQSGTFKYKLNCFRFTTKSPVSEMKRFFIGDCQNYNDVTWIGIPNGHEDTFLNKHNTKTIGTGELNIKLSMMHQSQEFLEERDKNVNRTKRIIFERLGSSTLIKSVEQVIREFKKARKEMLEARKNI